MPPPNKFSRLEILMAARSIVEEKGLDFLTFRSISHVLATSTSPVIHAFKRMEELKSELFSYLQEEMENYPFDRTGLTPWESLLCGYVLYHWKSPNSALALRRYFSTEGSGKTWNHFVATLKQDLRFKNWSQELLQKLAFRLNAYATGMGDYAAQGLLFNPTSQGIVKDLKEAFESLIQGVTL